jgi:hypothetical protein
MVLVLGVMLIVASLDAVPDPPAIDPHGAMAKASSLANCTGCFRDQPGAGTLQTRAQTQRISFTREEEPNRPTDFMAEAGQATDPSPPVQADRRPS